MLVDLNEAVSAAVLGLLAASALSFLLATGRAPPLALLFGRHDLVLGLPRGRRQVDELQVDIVVRRRLFPTASSAAAPGAPAGREGEFNVKALLQRDKFTGAGAGGG